VLKDRPLYVVDFRNAGYRYLDTKPTQALKALGNDDDMDMWLTVGSRIEVLDVAEGWLGDDPGYFWVKVKTPR
jgi:hypothetical protein